MHSKLARKITLFNGSQFSHSSTNLFRGLCWHVWYLQKSICCCIVYVQDLEQLDAAVCLTRNVFCTLQGTRETYCREGQQEKRLLIAGPEASGIAFSNM